MTKRCTAIIAFFLLLCLSGETFGQRALVTDAKRKELLSFSAKQDSVYVSGRQRALALAKIHGWDILRKTKNGGIVALQGVNSLGFPIYYMTDNNTIAAATTGTNTVQPGGALGLNLSGSSAFLNNKLAIWDGGSVYKGHQEFSGKTITLEDSDAIVYHATHVAGTMIAKGVYPPAKGMAFNAATLHSYSFYNDVAKMSAAAAQLLLSNHSYEDGAGWRFNDAANRWEWWGLPGDSVDYKFGFYGTKTAARDLIAFDAPYYLIVHAAGNTRGSPGPAVGQDYYGYRSISDPTFVDKGPRPAGISSNTGYDVIGALATAKNILTVGAIYPLPFGPANSRGIAIAAFSSWGPTDDGRVKPDLVADGVDVLSCGISSHGSYTILSGTSMAAPNVTGSLYLLQEYYAQKNGGNFMRAATLKGLACHTALDAGAAGPDYIYGWGLLDMKKAAQAITDDGSKSLLKENTLQQGQRQAYHVTASGNGPLAATISWTDPAGTPTAEGTINSRTPKLINDLDVRVSDGTTTFNPWILDPDHPSAAATTGDNIVDNVEQVYVPNAVPGKSYTVTVSHKGTLLAGSQDYSLIVTGAGGGAYCTSGPLSNAGSRVNNVTLSNLNYTPPAGCTSYSDHTDLTAQLEQGKTYPLSITLGTCGANFNKAARVYIDWNGNGVFDANELAATTNIINATGAYTTNITVPVSVIPGNFSIMRIVLTETSDTSVIKPCGTYAKGETQDYRVQFLQTGTDAGATAIVYPDTTACPSETPVTVTLKNFGGQPISNIPVTVTVTAPGNVVTTLNQTYTPTLQPLEQENFTLNGTINAVAGSTYQITAATNLANDPISANNGVSATIVISSPPTASGLSAYYCDNSKQYQLSGASDGELLWYQHSTDTIPFAYGSTVSVSQAPVNNSYYAGLNDFKGSIGPATKYVFTGGGYNQFTTTISVNTKIPVIIESARLYIGNTGKITFKVTDANGETVSTTTINAIATRTTPLPGIQADDPNDQGAVYHLNLLLPAAGNYTISTVYDSTATIYRNNSGVNGYPFTIGNLFSITGNSATLGADTAYYKGAYYYLYDIHLKSAGCASATKKAVTVTRPVITQNGTVLSSNFSSGNQWYLDGGIIPEATNQTFTPAKTGNYTAEVTLSTGCRQLSDNFVYVLISSTAGNNNDIGLVVYPVPASGQVSIIFASTTNANLTLSFINAAGKVVYTSEQAINQGNFSTAIDVGKLPPGGYVLKLVLGQKVYYNKIVIVR